MAFINVYTTTASVESLFADLTPGQTITLRYQMDKKWKANPAGYFRQQDEDARVYFPVALAIGDWATFLLIL